MYKQSFLNRVIISAILSEVIVFSSSEKTEFSLVPQSREKRTIGIPPQLVHAIQPHQVVHYELNFASPTLVQMIDNNVRFGYGYAIHPFIAVTFVNIYESRKNGKFNIATYEPHTSRLKFHHILDWEEDQNVAVMSVQMPFPMERNLRSISELGFSEAEINFASWKAQEFIQNRNTQAAIAHTSVPSTSNFP